MSKRNTMNRGGHKPYCASVRQADDGMPDGTNANQDKVPVLVEDTNTDEEECPSYLSKIRDSFGACFRKIASCCTIRWDADEDDLEESSESAAESAASPSAASPSAKTKPTIYPAEVAGELDEPDDPDDLDETPSRWAGLIIKTACAAAAVFVCAAGTFVYLQRSADPTGMPIAENAANVLTDSPSVADSIGHSNQAIETGFAAPLNIANAPQVGSDHLHSPFDSPFDGTPPFDSTPSAVSGTADSFADAFAAAPAIETAVTGLEELPAMTALPVATIPTPEPAAMPTTAELPVVSELPILSELPSLSELSIPNTTELPALAALSASPPVHVTSGPITSEPVTSGTATAPWASEIPAQNSFGFEEAPATPLLATTSHPTVQPTIPIIENIREIVPQIPPSGSIESIPPPPPPPFTDLLAEKLASESANVTAYLDEIAPGIPGDAEVLPQSSLENINNMMSNIVVEDTMENRPDEEAHGSKPLLYANESSPGIPNDGDTQTIPVYERTVNELSETPRILPAGSQPLDWHLWEQVRELRNDVDAEVANLRFEREPATTLASGLPTEGGTMTADATTEPALRFAAQHIGPMFVESPHPSLESETDDILGDTLQQFRELMPIGTMPTASLATASPTSITPPTASLPASESSSEDILSDLERVPPPVFAEHLPAYRIEQHAADSQTAANQQRLQEGGMTFQKRIEAVRQQARQQAQQQQVQQAAVRYIVQEGDTIFRLATDKLRDSTRWREIYALNADRLEDVRELRPGMEILLPAETARR